MKRIYIKKNDKLFLREEYNKPKYLKTFLSEYFESKNPETFYDKKRERIQQYRGAQRSFMDLYKLSKTYYPSIGLKDFVKAFNYARKKEKAFGRMCLEVGGIVFSNFWGKSSFYKKINNDILYPFDELAQHSYYSVNRKDNYKKNKIRFEDLKKILNEEKI